MLFKVLRTIGTFLDSIYGTHTPILALSMNHTDYYNGKGWYSMVTKPVDHNGLFRDLCIGWPCSVYKTTVLLNSKNK